jgi:hypothetical protein
MASVESLDEALEAQALGWRTFRVAPAGEKPARGEFGCPAAAENGKRLQCSDCLGCNGSNGRPGRASPMIWAHGAPSTIAAYNRTVNTE